MLKMKWMSLILLDLALAGLESHDLGRTEKSHRRRCATAAKRMGWALKNCLAAANEATKNLK